jgi:hypothetical protein
MASVNEDGKIRPLVTVGNVKEYSHNGKGMVVPHK